MKTALIQVVDQGPTESLVEMLGHAGYDSYLLSYSQQDELRSLGCDTVLSVEQLVKSWGYEAPSHDKLVYPPHNVTFKNCDLFVCVKAHRNGPMVWSKYPRLEKRTVWFRINGGAKEHVIRSDGFDCGNEINPPCPVITPNQWYAEDSWAYTHWPPFLRFDDYLPNHGRPKKNYFAPLCLIHRIDGWGYKDLVAPLSSLGIRFYGVGCPDGLLEHSHVPHALSCALAYVHLKSSDAPGYALYEALAAGCPVVCTRRLIWRCAMGHLLIPNETCLVFDRETHEGLTEQDVVDCTTEVRRHLDRLKDPEENRRLGMAGRQRLAEVMWRVDRDGEGFREWMERMFSV